MEAAAPLIKPFHPDVVYETAKMAHAAGWWSIERNYVLIILSLITSRSLDGVVFCPIKSRKLPDVCTDKLSKKSVDNSK